jgi:acid phosphatase
MRTFAKLLLLVSLIAIPAATTRAADVPVVVIMMENKSYAQIESYPAAVRSYLDAFAAGGTRFSNFTEGSSVGPSLPNYLQFAAGSSCGKTSNTVKPGDLVIGAACPTTLWNQLQGAGLSWGVYQEGMPTACSSKGNYGDKVTDGPYALRHNPATPFPSIWGDQALCKAHVLPFSAFNPSALPAVSFITPNICNDQHGTKSAYPDGTPAYQNCFPKSDALMQRGDAWLASHVPAMLAAGALVLITYDEQGVMYAAMQGPGIAVGVNSTALNHYGLLRGIENRYGLACLNNACTATVVPL